MCEVKVDRGMETFKFLKIFKFLKFIENWVKKFQTLDMVYIKRAFRMEFIWKIIFEFLNSENQFFEAPLQAYIIKWTSSVFWMENICTKFSF